ncbi:unnamed protein product [Cyprideis torosa]|uniref:Uncharacterized protein n=1 Tax=Cyprideis torosa TaxID=163714 RepID=A0A7R8W5C3_9CRUS|nr:unnamed protein product [Cyprideis torosa]CAG0884129.1 unnamed protein product [Cyprideis torosa]
MLGHSGDVQQSSRLAQDSFRAMKTFLAGGFRNFYKGNGAQMVRVFPYSALQFLSYEFYKKVYAETLGTGSHIARFLSGSSAGVTAVTLTYPLDVVRARLAFQGPGQQLYRGIGHVLVTLFQNEGGLRGLYRGYTLTMVGMVPYAGLSFYSFETLKGFFLAFPHSATVTRDSYSGTLILSVPTTLFCGAMSGALAQTFSYPLDVCRRTMQLSGMIPEFAKYRGSIFSTFLLIYREHGIRNGLYKGMSINYMRAIPMISVSFTTYEFLKKVFKLNPRQ